MAEATTPPAQGILYRLRKHSDLIGVTAALLCGLFFWFGQPISGLSPEGNQVLGSLIAWVILLTAEITDASIVTVIWLIFLIITQKTTPDIALSGFTNSTTWLLLGALMIGVACNITGLAKRVAYWFVNFTGDKFTNLTLWLLLSGSILGLLMPSGTARIAIYVPIYMGLCEVMKIEKGSSSALNLGITIIWAASIGAGSMMWLTGSVLNPIMTQSLAKFGVNQSWIDYAVYAFPSAVLLMLVVWLTLNFVSPPENKLIGGGRDLLRQEYAKLGPMSAAERRTLLLLSLCVILWILGKPLSRLTGLSLGSPWVAMACGCLLFFPKIGVLTGKNIKDISWASVLFIGSSLAISSLMNKVGIDAWSTESLVTPILSPFMKFGFIGFAVGMYILCHILHKLIPSGTGTVALCAPIMIAWGLKHGFDPTLMGHMTLHGMRPYIFPYEHTPAILMYSFGFMPMAKFLKVSTAVSATCLLWYVVSAFYWQFISTIYVSGV